MKKQTIYISLIALLMLSAVTSCKKLIEIQPSSTQLLTSTVFQDSVTTQSAIAGLYVTLSSTNSYRYGFSTYLGFSADELLFIGNTYDPFINNSLQTNDANVSNMWTSTYSAIYAANSLIEGVTNGSNISDKFKNQAIGEAKFVRSLCYFYLINLFGDVPLVLTTNVNTNASLPRTAVATIYDQIATDLRFAQSNLAADYSVSSNARTRANKWAATALLARVDLYTRNWVDAETQATGLISNTALFSLPVNLNQVFTPTSQEAIFQFYNDANGYTYWASAILPNPVAQVPKYVFTPQLAAAFETGDLRKTNWTSSLLYNGNTYTYPSKYKSLSTGANTEYYTVFRLAEQYLIRAEARTQQSNISGAQADVSAIRNRAGLANTTASTSAALLLAIEQERRIELNAEWGHRWMDLKRTGRVDAVMSIQKPTFWKSTAALYPVPVTQITANSNLSQNPGY